MAAKLNPQAFVTVRETLEALHISRSTYYRLVAEGRIHPVAITARRVLIPRKDIDAILKGIVK